MPSGVTLFAQIGELRRERAVRQNVYPRLIASGKLRGPKADLQIRCLEAAIETLEKVRAESGKP